MTSKSSDCSSAAFTATESTGSAPGPPHRRWPARPRRRGARSRPRGARLLHPLQAGSRRGAGDAAVRGQRQRRGQAHSSQKRAEGFHLGGQQAGAGAAGGVGAKGGGTRRAALASHGGPGAAARPPGSRAFFSSTMRSITLPANRPWSRAIWPGVRTASVAPCRRRPAPGAGARKISRPVASQPRPARCSGTPGCTCAPPGVGRQHPAGRSAAHLPPLSAGCAAWSCPHTLLGRCPPPRPRRHTQPPGIGGGREARAGRCTGAHATCCLGTGGAPSPPPPAAWALCTHPPPQRTKVGRASGGPGPGEDISACQPPPPPPSAHLHVWLHRQRPDGAHVAAAPGDAEHRLAFCSGSGGRLAGKSAAPLRPRRQARSAPGGGTAGGAARGFMHCRLDSWRCRPRGSSCGEAQRSAQRAHHPWLPCQSGRS